MRPAGNLDSSRRHAESEKQLMPKQAYTRKLPLKPYFWLIKFIGLIAPRRLRADRRREWESELRYRETLLAEWDRLGWRAKLSLQWRSLGAFADALRLQPKRLEEEVFQDLRYGLRMIAKSAQVA